MSFPLFTSIDTGSNNSSCATSGFSLFLIVIFSVSSLPRGFAHPPSGVTLTTLRSARIGRNSTPLTATPPARSGVLLKKYIRNCAFTGWPPFPCKASGSCVFTILYPSVVPFHTAPPSYQPLSQSVDFSSRFHALSVSVWYST